MRKTITLHTFKKFGRQQDDLARAMMPRTSAADPRVAEAMLLSRGNTVRTARTLTFTMAEVARG
jgi:hypothetical protein